MSGEPVYTLGDLDAALALDGPAMKVHADGTVSTLPDVTVPDVYAEVDDHGSYFPGTEETVAADLARQGWEPLRGHTGQYGSTSASWFMHASETVSGGLARAILATPGIYAAVVIYPDGSDDVEPTEWAIIRKVVTR